MNMMKRFVFLTLTLVLSMSLKADENVAQKDVKHNGMSWFWFGQAVIDCAQSAVCSFGHEDEHEEQEKMIVVMGREDLSKIKTFVKEKFFDKFICSPNFPDYRSISYADVIALYSIRLNPDDKLPLYDKVLVYIPISDQTAGGQYDDIVKEYHDLIKSIITSSKESPPKKKKWWQIFLFTSSLFASSVIFFYVRRKRKHENT